MSGLVLLAHNYALLIVIIIGNTCNYNNDTLKESDATFSSMHKIKYKY